jgi:hypothetical protein
MLHTLQPAWQPFVRAPYEKKASYGEVEHVIMVPCVIASVVCSVSVPRNRRETATYCSVKHGTSRKETNRTAMEKTCGNKPRYSKVPWKATAVAARGTVYSTGIEVKVAAILRL